MLYKFHTSILCNIYRPTFTCLSKPVKQKERFPRGTAVWLSRSMRMRHTFANIQRIQLHRRYVLQIINKKIINMGFSSKSFVLTRSGKSASVRRRACCSECELSVVVPKLIIHSHTNWGVGNILL